MRATADALVAAATTAGRNPRYVQARLRIPLDDFLSHYPEGSALTAQDITKYQSLLRSRLAPQTAESYWKVICRMLKLAAREGQVPQVLADALRPMKVPMRTLPTITDDEFEALLALPMFGTTRLSLLLAYDDGLRVSEVRGLRTSDVDIERLTLRIEGKGAKTRLIPILSDRLLAELKKALTSGRERLALWNRAHHESRQTFQLRRLCRRAGIRELPFHSLRHGFAHRAATVGGANIRAIQLVLGHANIAVTERYLQELGTNVENIAASFSGPFLLKERQVNYAEAAR